MHARTKEIYKKVAMYGNFLLTLHRYIKKQFRWSETE